jgi:L-ascorbate metabolism protein UlaG (beta-lactamase superfamily)
MRQRLIFLMMGLLIGSSSQAATFRSDTFKTEHGKELVITFIKHGTLMLRFDNHIIHVDPVSMYADYTQLPKADIILLTHEHGDHLDKVALKQVTREGTLLITNPASREILGKGTVMKNGDELTPTDYLHLEAVPAYNYSEGRTQYHPQHRDNGFILTLDGLRVYIAGDTEDIPEMKDIQDIDIAFLPVNQPYTMTIDQAVHAVNLFNPRILYPYHYGDTPIQQLVDRLAGSQTDVRIRDMQ